MQTVPAKGHSTVQMSYTPPPAEDVVQETDCISYALAYLSLDSDVSNVVFPFFFPYLWYMMEPLQGPSSRVSTPLVGPYFKAPFLTFT